MNPVNTNRLNKKERAVLVGVELPSRRDGVPLDHSLEELQRLAETAGASASASAISKNG